MFPDIPAGNCESLVLSAFNQRPAYFARWFEVVDNRVVDLSKILPRVFVAIETVQEQHIGEQAEHPVDVGRVTQKSTATGGCEKFLSELFAGAALENVARGEVDEIGPAAVAFERIAQVLFTDRFEDRFHLARRPMKRKIKDRRVGRAGIAP